MCQKIARMTFFNVLHIFRMHNNCPNDDLLNYDLLKCRFNNANIVLTKCNDHSTEVNGRAKVCDRREHQAILPAERLGVVIMEHFGKLSINTLSATNLLSTHCNSTNCHSDNRYAPVNYKTHCQFL